jgi:ribosomal protein L10
MSKTIKSMILSEYRDRLEGCDNATLISIRGVSSNDTNKIRKKLRDKKIQVSVVRNALARKAFDGTGLAGLEPLLQGATAMAYGGESVVHVAREIVALMAEFPSIELKGAILDGTLFKGKDGVKELSGFPTREEALSQTVTLILAPAGKLVSQAKGPGSALASIIKSIEEKLEKGETITRKAG